MPDTLHVIFKTHLDLGFTQKASAVRAQYHDHFIPMALDTGEHFLRENAVAPDFIWTTGSWLIWDHLQTQSPDKVRRLEKAIEAGIIAWHALPFTTHTELMSPALFARSIGITRELDARFGRHTVAAKMTDVPGHTLGAVEVMAEQGIEFLHLGVNSASPVPEVPPLFRWRAPSGAEIVVMYQDTYGAVSRPEGMASGIAFAHTHDNIGPQGVSQAVENLAHLGDEAPGLVPRASTLDAFWAELAPLRDRLPVVTSEIGDTWIHGVGSAPHRLSAFLAAQRLHDSLPDEVAPPFGQVLVEVPEHTWGVDIKTFLRDETAYDRPDFEAARQDDPRFAFCEGAWAEQDEIVDRALSRLPEADRARLDLPPAAPRIAPGEARPDRHRLGDWALEFDGETGALRTLSRDGRTILDGGDHFLFRQESYSAADLAAYLDSYITERVRWAFLDHAKPGLETARTQRSARFEPRDARVTEAGDTLWLSASMPADAVRDFGAPERVLTGWRQRGEDLEVTLHLLGKQPNRQPEAGFLVLDGPAPDLRLTKMGLDIDPRDIPRNGNRQLHAVARISGLGPAGDVEVDPLDAALFHVGAGPFLPHATVLPDLSEAGRFVLFNNKWGTNFSMWSSGNMAFRFLVGHRPG